MRKKLFSLTLLFALCLSLCACAASPAAPPKKAADAAATPPTETQTDKRPVVYFTKNISPDGMKKLYARVGQNIIGRTAIKFHRHDHYTETPAGVALVKALQQSIPNSVLVETTFGGGRSEAKEMQARFKGQGLDFCPIDVLNEDGGTEWPVKGGRLMKSALIAKNLANYDSLVIYAPFRGQAYPGYGAALTNIGVGLQDGKGRIHGSPLNKDPEFFERMAEGGKAVVDHFGQRVAYVTLLENVVVNCDCNMNGTLPATYGLVASTDIVAVDRAALDIAFSAKEHQLHSLTEKKGTLLGLWQLEYMERLGMGSPKYKLVDIDK